MKTGYFDKNNKSVCIGDKVSVPCGFLKLLGIVIKKDNFFTLKIIDKPELMPVAGDLKWFNGKMEIL